MSNMDALKQQIMLRK